MTDVGTHLRIIPAALAAALAAAVPAAADSAGIIEATFACENGTVLDITFDNEKQVAIVKTADLGPLTLPIGMSGSGYYYSNGQYGLRGKGDEAMWEVGRMAPINCRQSG